jgi:hypothetical protein
VSTAPPWEPTAWLRDAINKRLAEMMGRVPDFDQDPTFTVIVFALTEPPEDTPGARKRWEFTCDRCGAYCPGAAGMADTLITASVAVDVPGDQKVLITMGMCRPCSEREKPPGMVG